MNLLHKYSETREGRAGAAQKKAEECGFRNWGVQSSIFNTILL
jgi:hypothetical protein